MKKILALILCLLVILSVPAFAEEVAEIEWQVDDGCLEIFGEGNMKDYGGMNYYGRYYDKKINYAPWKGKHEKITEIYVDKGIDKIGNMAFYGLDKAERAELPKGLKIIGGGAFSDCVSLKEIQLPSTLTEIGVSAFRNCSIETIFIPRKVESIGAQAFTGCTKLKEILVDEDNKVYLSSDGVLYSKDKTILYDYPDGGEAVYTILPTVTTIYDKAFRECQAIERVQIPKSVTRIGEDAFYYANSLKTIDYEGSKEDWKKITNITGYNDLKGVQINYDCVIETKTPREIVLTIGQTKAMVFGEEKVSDVAPKIVNDRTMLPARFVAENLGAEVFWQAEEADKILIKKDDIEIVMYINKDVAYVNGEEIELDSAPFVEQNRTFTPVRFIVENLGAEAEWNNDTKQVTITLD